MTPATLPTAHGGPQPAVFAAELGTVQFAATPLRLRLGERCVTLRAMFPWCPTSAGDGSGGGVSRLAYEPVPLSEDHERELATSIAAAFCLASVGGIPPVVGVRQEHYSPVTPLRMIPRIPPHCLRRELTLVLRQPPPTPSAGITAVAPVPRVFRLDAATALDCAERLRTDNHATTTTRARDIALCKDLCRTMSTRGFFRLILAPHQLEVVRCASAALDRFCALPSETKARYRMQFGKRGSGKWAGYSRQPRREFLQVRRLVRVLFNTNQQQP